ncbi:PilZ domain-containing protein [Allohahella marinimesophila]|uniref:PilZ domain-containing protein n=1 Tax=Allohahella marinimesophila TaxID=1054972 RepID=A0ABP7NQX2_9GAMM
MDYTSIMGLVGAAFCTTKQYADEFRLDGVLDNDDDDFEALLGQNKQDQGDHDDLDLDDEDFAAAAKSKELRQHQRIKASFRVEVVHPDTGVMQSQTRDISESGAFIKIKNELLSHKNVIIQLRVLGLPTGPGELVTGRVVRVEEDGLGVLFVQVDSDGAANDDY